MGCGGIKTDWFFSSYSAVIYSNDLHYIKCKWYDIFTYLKRTIRLPLGGPTLQKQICLDSSLTHTSEQMVSGVGIPILGLGTQALHVVQTHWYEVTLKLFDLR